MKHAGPPTLAGLKPLLVELRGLAGLVERSPGAFYRKGVAFLHFHENAAGLFADVKLHGRHFERYCVSTPAQQKDLLADVRRAVGSGQPT
jgi:hypothetical protein